MRTKADKGVGRKVSFADVLYGRPQIGFEVNQLLKLSKQH